MFDFLGNILSGGLLGAVGAIATNVMGYFQKKLEYKQQIELKKMDIELADKEWAYRKDVALIDAEAKKEESADQLLSASYSTDSATYSKNVSSGFLSGLLVFVDFIRGMIRPILTVYLVWEVHKMRGDVEIILKQVGIVAITAIDAINVYKEVIGMILFLCATAVTWWFGSRAPKERKSI